MPGNPAGIPTNKSLIFGTAGSQVQDYEFKVRQFFNNLIDMMKTQRMDDYHLVLAVGDKLLAQLNVEYGALTWTRSTIAFQRTSASSPGSRSSTS